MSDNNAPVSLPFSSRIITPPSTVSGNGEFASMTVREAHIRVSVFTCQSYWPVSGEGISIERFLERFGQNAVCEKKSRKYICRPFFLWPPYFVESSAIYISRFVVIDIWIRQNIISDKLNDS